MSRWANVALGLWLVVSAFLWPHSSQQFTNAWIIGALVTVMAMVAATGQAWARYVNATAAAWLFLSTFFFPRVSAGTAWNHVLVAVAIFVFAMITGRPAGAYREASGQPVRT
jgi:hypothetical protein